MNVYFVTSVLYTGLYLSVVSPQENIALNKPANHTNQFGGFDAGRAVDGDRYAPACALFQAPGEGLQPQWWVDLGRTYRVTRLIIYNTGGSSGDPRWLRNFIFSIGPSLADLTDCTPEFTTQVPYNGQALNCNQVGRFLHFRKVSGHHQVMICEVIVRGIIQYDCSRCPDDNTCDADRGCRQCPAGASGPECQPCEVGRYGVNCASSCGQCGQPMDCSRVDGTCSGLCQRWWTMDKCDYQIVAPIRTDETAEVRDTTNSSLTVRWQQISVIPSDIPEFYGYSIKYKKMGESQFTEGPDVAQSRSMYNSVILKDLDYNKEYEVVITPYREHQGQRLDESPYPTQSMKTSCGFPDPVAGAVADKVPDVKIIRVSWESIESSGVSSRCASISGLRVEHRKYRDPDWTVEEVDVADTSRDVVIMEDGTYEVRVITVNNQNFESSSRVLAVTFGASSSVAVIVSVVVVLVLVAAAAVVMVIVLKRRRAKKTDEANGRAETGKMNPTFVRSNGGDVELDSNIVKMHPGPDQYAEVVKQKPEPNTLEKPGKKPKPNPSPVIQTSKNRDHVPATYENVIITIPDTPDVNDGFETEEETDVPEVPVRGDLEMSAFDLGPVAVDELEEFATRKKRDFENLAKEYKSLPANDNGRCKMGQTADNKKKNRFLNIYPYDDTRVVLKTDNGRYTSDYINANYITGHKKKQEYIATQGPRQDTMIDFWRMIWQEKASRVVMVANLTEGGKKRCAQYWPDTVGTTLKCGDYKVTMEGQEICADYTHRTLTLKHGTGSQAVHQLHFTSWEDKNNPVYGAGTLFAFHRKVRAFDSLSRGPMVVHCSAGVGRTGTFIVFDILMNQARQVGAVDVYGWVKRVRQERMTMVQTKGQYIFLHDALVEYLRAGDTCYSASDFMNKFPVLSKPDRDGQSEIRRQFNILQSTTPNFKTRDCQGLTPENAHKNRDQKIVADDNHRPYLNIPCQSGNDYINAVFVSSYEAHRHYIVTQMPLPDTTVDFWRLVYEQGCNTIIMLNDLNKNDSTCVPYWPSQEQQQIYGPIEVETAQSSKTSGSKFVKTRNFNVRLSSSKNTGQTLPVRHFRFTGWSTSLDTPPSVNPLLELMDSVRAWQTEGGHRPPDSRILVHCLNGVDQSGVYCALSCILDRMETEQVVDPYFAVQTVRRSRPQFVNKVTQFKFLYGVAAERSNNCNEYANVPR